MAEADQLAHERKKAQFDVGALKVVWAGSQHALQISDRMAKLVASDPVFLKDDRPRLSRKELFRKTLSKAAHAWKLIVDLRLSGYMKALDKLVPDEDECDKIRQQLSQYMLGQGAFGTNHALRNPGNLSSLAWWNVYGGGTPQLQCLATRVLSQVVNISSAERCWSTYSFIHNVKRNRLNAGWVESLVYVHYNLRLLSHYCEEAKEEKNLKCWDNHPEENNLEDGVMLLEQLENALFDDDDHVEMPAPATTQSLVPLFRTPTAGASSSSTAQFRDRPSQAPPLPPSGGTHDNRVGGRRMG